MSNYKFTPGPWRAYGKPFQKTNTLQAMAVRCGNGPGNSGHKTATAMARTAEETEANAKLIAAAPELLKFAEHFLDNLEGFMPEAVRTIAELKALIKKATE